MDILFVIDRLELKYFEFNDLVTNFWIIRELLNAGRDVKITIIDNLSLKDGIAFAGCYNAFKKNGDIFYDKELKQEKNQRLFSCYL